LQAFTNAIILVWSIRTNIDKEERRMSLTMDQIHRIRQLYYEQGQDNISEIARLTGLNRKTVTKYIDMTDFNVPEPVPKTENLCPKLDPFKPLIDQWLEEDKKVRRKQRHSATKVFNRLTDEVKGFNCSKRLVAEYVKEKKKQLNLKRKEGSIPLNHDPGEAQGDFGAADFYENSLHYSGKYFVIDFPYSNNGYLQLHRGENMECLLESMKAIFEHIGGVPTEIWFDNTRTIVTKILSGGDREITERFTRFQEHYGFQATFCNPYSGNEKGGVENKVGYDRRNMLVPVPRFLSLEQYNKQLLQMCDEDSDREHYRFKGETIKDRFEADRKALRPLPDQPFDTAHYQAAHTDGWGKFTLQEGKHTYSASPGHAGSDVWLKITAEHVLVMDLHQKPIVTHRRLYGDEPAESMEWLPYLKYIALKPRSLFKSGIYDMMPLNMQKYLFGCKNSDRGKVLKALSELTERTGFDSAVQTVNQAIQYEATDPDSLKNLYRMLYADVPALPPLTGHTDIPAIGQMPSGLSDYDSLLWGRGCGT
jgi:transposase